MSAYSILCLRVSVPTSQNPPDAPQVPKVSVLVVSWNCVQALRRCLQSVRQSKGFEHIETLVVDAGSHDGSERIDEEFSWITPLRLPRNFGKTRARNIGVRTATGEFILLLSPDAEVQPETISQLSSHLQTNEDWAAVSATVRDAHGIALKAAYRLPSASELKAACQAGTGLPVIDLTDGPAEAVADHALMVRKVFLKGMNYFEEKRFSEFWSDMEMCYQIQNSGKKLVIAGDAVVRLNQAERSTELDPSARALLAADRISGAAGYIGKRYGVLQGLLFRLSLAFSNLLDFRLFIAILSGSRVDGTQGGVLG